MVNFLKNYQKCLGYFGSDGSCSILKPPEKKTPESKNRNDEFPENHQKCFGFFGSDSSRSILEPPEKKGEIITKISVPDRKPPEKKVTRVKKESKR